jgi:hypothetical protein
MIQMLLCSPDQLMNIFMASESLSKNQSLFFPAALTAFHRALAAAAILALPAALICLLPFPPFFFAHLAFCAAAILARPEADTFLLGVRPLEEAIPNNSSN